MITNSSCRLLSIAMSTLLCFSLGCNPPTPKKVVKEDKQQPNLQGGIVGKTTTEVGEWDPDANRNLREEGGDKVNMINRNIQGLSYATHEIARLKVKQSLELFRATEGRYPKSHEEFMEKVFKVYVKELPMPVTTAEYMYDVENHELLVVDKVRE